MFTDRHHLQGLQEDGEEWVERDERDERDESLFMVPDALPNDLKSCAFEETYLILLLNHVIQTNLIPS